MKFKFNFNFNLFKVRDILTSISYLQQFSTNKLLILIQMAKIKFEKNQAK